jgi:hypothetical protein
MNPMTLPRSLNIAFAATLVLAAGQGAAHDTWFEPRTTTADGGRWMALGTGNQFPAHETAIAPEYLQHSGCRRGAGAAGRLVALRPTATALMLRSPPATRGLSCWAQLQPFEIELAPDKIGVYLDEINASAALRTTWAEMHARGLPWKERYTKHARIELRARGTGPVPAAQPSGMGLELLLDGSAQPLQPADAFGVRVLRDGLPLPKFAIQLRSERTRLGIWRETDADGRAQFQLPWAGRWLLRGVELRLSQAMPDTWESRFATLAFDVAPPAPLRSLQSSGSSPKARSANQAPAMNTITSEPPASTARR